jgi:hypothetical protein
LIWKIFLQGNFFLVDTYYKREFIWALYLYFGVKQIWSRCI